MNYKIKKNKPTVRLVFVSSDYEVGFCLNKSKIFCMDCAISAILKGFVTWSWAKGCRVPPPVIKITNISGWNFFIQLIRTVPFISGISWSVITILTGGFAFWIISWASLPLTAWIATCSSSAKHESIISSLIAFSSSTIKTLATACLLPKKTEKRKKELLHL